MSTNKVSSYAESILAIQAGKIKVFSLDFFDTLVWRNVSRARDVFLYIGVQLQEKGLLAQTTDPQLFAHAREIAERNARRHHALPSGAMEVRLDEIYSFFSLELVNCSASELVSAGYLGFYHRTTGSLGTGANPYQIVIAISHKPMKVLSCVTTGVRSSGRYWSPSYAG